MRPRIKTLWKGVRSVLTLYLLYALIGSTVPWLPIISPKPDEARLPALDPYAQNSGDEGNDRALLIETPEDAFAVRVQMIRAAEKSLDIAYYALATDACGQAFLGEVLSAADRGVRVRILLDGKINGGSTSQAMSKLAAHPNIECRRYNPFDLLRPWKWHAILHDKFIFVDEKHLLLGGRNISDRFYAPASYEGKITQDRDALVTRAKDSIESVCTQMKAYVDHLWNGENAVPYAATADGPASWPELVAKAASFERENPVYYAKSFDAFLAEAHPTRSVRLVVNPIHTQRKTPYVGNALGTLAMNATSSVMIQTPYATASKTLLDALATIDANADTTLLTNSLASSPNYFAYSNYYSQRRRFLGAGLDIYELQSEHSIHGKSMVVDNRLSAVGSFNMDDRSFFIDTESMLIIDSEPFARSLRAAIDRYIDQSLLVGPDNRYIESASLKALPVSMGKRMMMAATSVFSRLFSFLI